MKKPIKVAAQQVEELTYEEVYKKIPRDLKKAAYNWSQHYDYEVL